MDSILIGLLLRFGKPWEHRVMDELGIDEQECERIVDIYNNGGLSWYDAFDDVSIAIQSVFLGHDGIPRIGYFINEGNDDDWIDTADFCVEPAATFSELDLLKIINKIKSLN